MDRRGKIAGISLSSMMLVALAVPLALVLQTATAPSVAAWDNLTGGDHGGADWIITTDTTIAGIHTNTGLFRIASGVTVTVQAYDGINYGLVEIHAENIVIEGTLDASGRGYRAYEGPGRGGILANSDEVGGGGGGYGGSGGRGGNYSGGPGAGGAGGGTYGSASGPDMEMGSGGGHHYHKNYGYFGGGRGGGCIELFGDNINISGIIRSDGSTGYSGGSGGGIKILGKVVNVSGTLSAKGAGGSYYANVGGGGGGGGRIKIFWQDTFNFSSSYNVAGGAGSGGVNAGLAGAVGTFNAIQWEFNPPSIIVNAPQSQLYNLNPLLDVDFYDDSNVKDIYYQIDSYSGTWKNLTSDGSTIIGQNVNQPSFTTDWYISTADWNALTTETHTLYFKVVDNYGNEKVGSAPSLIIRKNLLPEILSITVDNVLVDRKVDFENSGATSATQIAITVRDNNGRNTIALENVRIWIRDGSDIIRVDNQAANSYENIGENIRRFYFVYDPLDTLPDASLGPFDVKVQVFDNYGLQDNKDFNELGSTLFTISDLNVTLSVTDNTPIYQISTSGTIARVYGTVSADNVRIVDNNQGEIATTSTDNTYSKTYGLVSPVRLHRGDRGQLYVRARDGTLDGISPTLTYRVEGDNATVLITTVNNQVGQSVIILSVAWGSDSAKVGSGTCYFETESPEAVITNGTGQFTLDHSTWITSGARVISLYDNADRPLWNVTVKPTLITKSLVWTENQALSGSQDNASLTIKITYNDGSTNPTIKAELLAGTMDNGQVTADENGLLIWSGINIPDNTQDIQIKLDNVYDSRTDWVINANSVEDTTLYTENTTCSFTFTDNDQTIYHGSSTTLSGTLTSQANYVFLTVKENLYHENGDLVENKSVILSPGASDGWSFSLSPMRTENYVVKMLSPSGVLMWQHNARITVKLQTPTLTSPDNVSATTDNTPMLSWENVSGATSYTVQSSTYENFDNVDGTTTEFNTSENNLTLVKLMENMYYWRVKATTIAANVENSDWSSTRNFWVDKTNPSIWSFLINSGASETTSSSVTLSISASDSGSGVYQMCFKNEDGSWSAWEPYSTSKSWTLSSGDGLKTVYVKVRDRALNESSILSDGISKTTYVPPGGGETPPADTTSPTPPADNTPPTLMVLEPTTTEVSENVTVRVSASDSSGIDPGSILMTLDGGTVQHTYSGGEIARSFVRLSAGGHLVVVRVSDASSNHNQATVNISFTVVAPVENVENVVENVENTKDVTSTPSFTLQLPATPLEVENGYAQITLWITNPAPQPILKHCELRFNNHVKPFDLEVAAGEDMLVTVWIDVVGMKGTYDMKLYDADTDTVLDEGEITLLAAAEQPEVPPIAVTSPFPSLPIAALGAVGVVVGLGVLRIACRLPKIKMPKFRLKLPKIKITRSSVRLPSLPRLPKIRNKLELEKRSGPEDVEFKEISERTRGVIEPPEAPKEVESELVEESPVVQDICHLLEPAARELATKKKVGHLGRAVKPYKKRRR